MLKFKEMYRDWQDQTTTRGPGRWSDWQILLCVLWCCILLGESSPVSISWRLTFLQVKNHQ